MADYVPCPQCGSPHVQQVSFTWWGGVLGPKILHHVRCQNCRNTFNGKTGQPNTVPIIIYSVVVFFIALVLMVLLLSMMKK
jgi:hypothetical protein